MHYYYYYIIIYYYYYYLALSTQCSESLHKHHAAHVPAVQRCFTISVLAQPEKGGGALWETVCNLQDRTDCSHMGAFFFFFFLLKSNASYGLKVLLQLFVITDFVISDTTDAQLKVFFSPQFITVETARGLVAFFHMLKIANNSA